MMNRKFGVALFLLGLLVASVPRFILPVCEYQGFNPMTCSHTGTAESFVGLIILAAAAGLFFSKSSEGLRLLSFVALVAGICVVLLPSAIGYCHSDRMPCNYGTVPALRLLGALTILLSLGGGFFSFRGAKE
jgi:hypothetical protein